MTPLYADMDMDSDSDMDHQHRHAGSSNVDIAIPSLHSMPSNNMESAISRPAAGLSSTCIDATLLTTSNSTMGRPSSISTRIMDMDKDMDNNDDTDSLVTTSNSSSSNAVNHHTVVGSRAPPSTPTRTAGVALSLMGSGSNNPHEHPQDLTMGEIMMQTMAVPCPPSSSSYSYPSISSNTSNTAPVSSISSHHPASTSTSGPRRDMELLPHHQQYEHPYGQAYSRAHQSRQQQHAPRSSLDIPSTKPGTSSSGTRASTSTSTSNSTGTATRSNSTISSSSTCSTSSSNPVSSPLLTSSPLLLSQQQLLPDERETATTTTTGSIKNGSTIGTNKAPTSTSLLSASRNVDLVHAHARSGGISGGTAFTPFLPSSASSSSDCNLQACMPSLSRHSTSSTIVPGVTSSSSTSMSASASAAPSSHDTPTPTVSASASTINMASAAGAHAQSIPAYQPSSLSVAGATIAASAACTLSSTDTTAAPTAASAAAASISATPSAASTGIDSTRLEGRYKRYAETQIDYKPGGYARIKEGDRLNYGRYEIVKKLGVGHFSVVWLAWDREDGGYVAIKVVRSSKRYSRAAHHEDRLLTVISGPRDERKRYIVSFLNSFEEKAWEGPETHYCLVFELMGMSLTDVLRKNDFNGLPIKTTKLITKQILTGLSFLHSLGIAHTDVKPDNILLHHSSKSMSKILRQQLEEDDIEKARQEVEDSLKPKQEPIDWLNTKPKIPGLTPLQIREIQFARIRSEQRKWVITPSKPLESPIPFADGTRVTKEYVLANKHLYKRPRPSVQAREENIQETTERTSVTHPVSSQSDSSQADNNKAANASTQTTPTKEGVTPAASNVTSARSSISPKRKDTIGIDTTESSLTAPSSRQSSKSPFNSLRRIEANVSTSSKDSSPSTQFRKTFEKMNMGIGGSQQYQQHEGLSNLFSHSRGEEAYNSYLDSSTLGMRYGLNKHSRESSNGSGASHHGGGVGGGGEMDFEKLLRQPTEFDRLSGNAGIISAGGPLPVFMAKSSPDSNGRSSSEIFSPAFTNISRYFSTAAGGGGGSTGSPASMASTPICSSPELPMARKVPSPIFSYSNSHTHQQQQFVSLPRTMALGPTRSSTSFSSFSPAEHSLLETDYRYRGILAAPSEPSTPYGTGLGSGMAHPSRARSSFSYEDCYNGSGSGGSGIPSLPVSPPSHPTSYVSLASMSPEIRLNRPMVSSILSRSNSDFALDGSFELGGSAIAAQAGGTQALFDFGAGGRRRNSEDDYNEEHNLTIIGGNKRVLPGISGPMRGLGLSMASSSPPKFGRLNIPQSETMMRIGKASSSSTDASSALLSSSPPASMSSSILSGTSEMSAQSQPQSQSQPSPSISSSAYPVPKEYKTEPLTSANRIKSDPLLNVHVKLADLGNAIYYNECKARGTLPENVCTRQYRPPENIIQAPYDLGIDVWALGCVVFEMITGEMMFNPSQEKYRYTKEDDLLGQQIEILGEFPPEFSLSGKKSLCYFSRQGRILRVRLSPWPLFDVMVKKYYMPRSKAIKFTNFLLRMLEPDPSKRATVDELLQDPWLNEIEEDDDFVLYTEKRRSYPPPPPPQAQQEA